MEVTCVQCRAKVPANRADFSVDGMVCPSCANKADVANKLGITHVGDGSIALAERSFARSRAIKQLALGVGGLALAVPVAGLLVWMFANGGVPLRLVYLLVVLIGGGGAELLRGLRGMRNLPPLPPGADDFPKAIVVRRD
jgi:hypothetical protein